MRCEKCGSPKIMRDASVEWSVGAQAWQLVSMEETVYCHDCGEYIVAVEHDLEEDK
jgi:hypothetical protein